MMENDDFVLVDTHDGDPSDDEGPVVTPQDLERIKLWLSPTEFDSEGSEYRKHLNAHVPGTGDWLFETQQYKSWYGVEDGFGKLWIQGIPGSGKSVIAANLIQTLKSEQENVPVLFFFSRRIIKSNSEPHFLVRDCLHQLLHHSITLQRRLKGHMERYSAVGNVPFHELWRTLVFGLSIVPKAYLVFDALDELATEDDNFLQCLVELGQQKSESIKLIMTSRPLPHFQSTLKGSLVANVRLSGQKVEKDINTYIAYRLTSKREKSLSPEDQSAIRSVLSEKGQGLFLYARLMLDELLQRSTPVSVQLQCLPSSLEDMYLDLLSEHSSRSGASLHFQTSLLSWVTHASRPLRVTELAALADSHEDRGGLIESQDAKLMVQTSCGPLLEILDDETVQVLHHSFTEFLLDSSRSSAEKSTESDRWFPALLPADIHRTLTFSCVDYLKSGCFDSWSVDKRSTSSDYVCRRKSSPLAKQRLLMAEFNLLQYTTRNLLYHAAKCDRIDMSLHHKLDELMQYGSHNFESWKDFWFAREEESPPNAFHPLHVAAQAGLTAYAVWILEKGEDQDIVDSEKRTPASYAAMYGHSETLTTLLDWKASITISDWDGLQSIHHAAKGNHVKALRCLLDAGADPMLPKSNENHNWYIHLPPTTGTTPMQLACEMGNTDVVVEMLKDLTSSSRDLVMPHWAAATGQAKVLSVLFQYPELLANVNKKDSHGNVSLYLAACIGDSATVRVLLENGADVHSRSDDWDSCKQSHSKKKAGVWRTPLQGWANAIRNEIPGREFLHGSVEEWEKTATLLLVAKSNIEARDAAGRAVLHCWTEQNNYDRGDSDRSARFVSLLLKHGANPRVTDERGNTPLHLHQIWQQDPRIFELLTKGGADINATRPGDLETPLIAYAKANCTRLDFKLYAENGADFNLQDAEGNTALHHICSSWLFEFSDAKEWLTVADPTIRNNKGETCLYNLGKGKDGHDRNKVISLLMEKGLDIEAKDRLGRTALLSFCKRGEPFFIKELVRIGANVRARDFRNKSCLHLVAQSWLVGSGDGTKDLATALDTVDILIKAGADINGVDFDGNTPFFDAVESSGYFLERRLRLVLKSGGVANTTNHRGQTALHKVAALQDFDPEHGQYQEVAERIEFLLQDGMGIDLNATDNEGMMAIHTAASTSAITTWKLSVAGADIQSKATDLRTPLHFAATAAQSDIVGLLCGLHKDKCYTVDQLDETGWTALHYAAQSGSSECVYYLLKAGADPNMKGRHGMTTLHIAAEHKIDIVRLRKQRKYERLPLWSRVTSGMHDLLQFMDTRKESVWDIKLALYQEEDARLVQDVVRLLLSAGADPTVCDKSGQTPYDVAILLENEEMVQVLSGLPGSLNKSDPDSAYTRPLHDSDSSQRSAFAHNPLAHHWNMYRTTGAEEVVRSTSVKDIEAYTLLHTAICLRNEALVEALLKSGVDPLVPGPDSLAPIHIVAYFGLTSMMKIISSHIKDLNAISPPLLHAAARRKSSNIQMVDLLIELGVNVNTIYKNRDDEQDGPMKSQSRSDAVAHILAIGRYWWNSLALESICKAGANLELTDKYGITPLQCSLDGSRSGIWQEKSLEVLLKYGANVNVLTRLGGTTPLNSALASYQCRKLIQKLLDAGADITLGKIPAIFSAIRSNDIEATAAILDAGGDVNAVLILEYFKNDSDLPEMDTPLLSAAHMNISPYEGPKRAEMRRDKEEIMALLIQRGANPSLELPDGKTTVIHEIAYHNGIIAPVLRGGVDLEARDSQNRTLLLAACSPVIQEPWMRTEDEFTPCELILAGADIEATDCDGMTPLHLGVKSGLFQTCALLLEHGSSVSALNAAGLSPLYYALSLDYRYQRKFAIALLAAGADPLIVGPNGETPLHLLAQSLMQVSQVGPIEIPKRSLPSIWNPERDDPDYLVELISLYRLFVDKGCDRNSCDHFGNTPLFTYVREVTSRRSNMSLESSVEGEVRTMFDEHDIFAVNNEGETLLHAIASRQEGRDTKSDGVFLFKELLERGLDPKKENKKRISALDVAAACGKEGILALFAREE